MSHTMDIIIIVIIENLERNHSWESDGWDSNYFGLETI